MWVKQTDHFDKQDVVKRGKGVKLQVSAQNRAGRRTGQAKGVCMFHEAVSSMVTGGVLRTAVQAVWKRQNCRRVRNLEYLL